MNDIRINLSFPVTVQRLTDNPYGKKIFAEQVADKIDYGEMNIIHFPDHIIRASSSFVQGFFTDIVNTIGYDNLHNHITIDSINQSLVCSIWDNLL